MQETIMLKYWINHPRSRMRNDCVTLTVTESLETLSYAPILAAAESV